MPRSRQFWQRHRISNKLRYAVTSPELLLTWHSERNNCIRGGGGSEVVNWLATEMVLWSVRCPSPFFRFVFRRCFFSRQIYFFLEGKDPLDPLFVSPSFLRNVASNVMSLSTGNRFSLLAPNLQFSLVGLCSSTLGRRTHIHLVPSSLF